MDSFYLFFHFPELKDLLIDEVKAFHPVLRLSFSNKNFLSFKGPKGYQKALKERPLIFVKRMEPFFE